MLLGTWAKGWARAEANVLQGLRISRSRRRSQGLSRRGSRRKTRVAKTVHICRNKGLQRAIVELLAFLFLLVWVPRHVV